MDSQERIEILERIQDKFRCKDVQVQLLQIANELGNSASQLKVWCEQFLVRHEKSLDQYRKDWNDWDDNHYSDWVYSDYTHSPKEPTPPAVTIEDLKLNNARMTRIFEFTEEEKLALDLSYASKEILKSFK